jgi:hypothetical protein
MKSPPGTTMVAVLVHVLVAFSAASSATAAAGDQPLSKIGIHRTTFEIHPGAFVDVPPLLLGLQVSFPAATNTRVLLYHCLNEFTNSAPAPLPMTVRRDTFPVSGSIPELEPIWSITATVDDILMSSET